MCFKGYVILWVESPYIKSLPIMFAICWYLLVSIDALLGIVNSQYHVIEGLCNVWAEVPQDKLPPWQRWWPYAL